MNDKKRTVATYDIETIAREDLNNEDISAMCKIGNLKDPNKIAAKQAEARSKLGCNPLTAMACCGAWYADEDNCGYVLLKDTSPEAEKEFLIEYWAKLVEFDLLISFNGLAFDSRILLLRSAVHEIEMPFKIDRKKYSTTGNHIDLYSVLTDFAPFGQGKLSFFLDMFGLAGKTDDMDGSLVQEFWNEGLHKEIGEYCIQDCEQTFQLYEKIKRYFL